MKEANTVRYKNWRIPWVPESRYRNRNPEYRGSEGECRTPQGNPGSSTLVANRTYRAAIQPGQHEQAPRSRTLATTPGKAEHQIGRHCAQDRVERREVPHGVDVIRRPSTGLGNFKVRLFPRKKPPFRGRKEHHNAEQNRNTTNTDDILDRVVRVESGCRPAACRSHPCTSLDINAIRVVGTHSSER